MQASDPLSPPAKIPLINGLRGLAILGVVFHHLFGQTFVQGGYILWLGRFPFTPLTILSNSYQGVALFFLLSAFVLTLPYAQGRRTMQSLQDAKEFFGRRAKRLLPLYFLALLIGFIFVTPTEDFVLFAKRAFFFFTGTFTFTEKFFFPEVNFVLWSLSLELLFCLFFPFILYVMQKYGTWRVVISCSIFALLARLFGLVLLQQKIATLFTGTTIPIFNSIFCRIDDFVLGMALAFLYVKKPKLNPFIFYPISFLLLYIGFSARDLTMGVLPLIFQPFTNTFVNIGFFLLVAIMLLQTNLLSRWLFENRVLQTIGLMSYSLFVWHGVAMAPLNANVDALHLIRYAILVISLSFLTYRYVECGTPRKLRDILPKKALQTEGE